MKEEITCTIDTYNILSRRRRSHGTSVKGRKQSLGMKVASDTDDSDEQEEPKRPQEAEIKKSNPTENPTKQQVTKESLKERKNEHLAGRASATIACLSSDDEPIDDELEDAIWALEPNTTVSRRVKRASAEANRYKKRRLGIPKLASAPVMERRASTTLRKSGAVEALVSTPSLPNNTLSKSPYIATNRSFKDGTTGNINLDYQTTMTIARTKDEGHSEQKHDENAITSTPDSDSTSIYATPSLVDSSTQRTSPPPVSERDPAIHELIVMMKEEQANHRQLLTVVKQQRDQQHQLMKGYLNTETQKQMTNDARKEHDRELLTVIREQREQQRDLLDLSREEQMDRRELLKLVRDQKETQDALIKTIEDQKHQQRERDLVFLKFMQEMNHTLKSMKKKMSKRAEKTAAFE
ncbi:CYFA0S02e05481g1_1 [Cyberlindnera fabianii]|uniref:CYFA0S02e05481g1_1 n=1 Tax=Cyberlindnera fabianii TaxID=36022 RepID=A0A061ANN8_CYBFA|nr:hypothetical protein BON22_0102 [Cyberlindnera fabianii]CDR38768.1 CYFA0S02e05481g1_1 [Cyberlindnera fabianii]